MEEVITGKRQGWASTSLSHPLSPTQKRSTKSIFTKNKSRFEVVDVEGEGDDFEDQKPSRLSRSGKTHTSIEIETEEERPSSSRRPKPRSSRPRPKFHKSDDEESIQSLEHVDEFNATTTDTDAGVLGESGRIRKTTSALLLAEEASIILGSPLNQNGSTRNYWTCTTFILPTHWTKEDWEEWYALLFYPSSRQVPENDKIEETFDKRVPSEEGLFTGEPVQIAKGNWNRLQWRLLKQNANYWFGSDGKLFCYPDPYRKDAVQLFREGPSWFLDEELKEILDFFPAKLNHLQDYQRSSYKPFELELDLGYVNFMHHPFFSKEHVIASTLQVAFDTYSKRRQERVTDRAVNKLEALREAVSHTKSVIDQVTQQLENDESNAKEKFRESLSQHKTRLASYRNEIRKHSLIRDQGYWDDKASTDLVLQLGKELKSLRDHQGCINTLLKVGVIELPVQPHKDLEKWEQDIENDLQDIEEENEEIFEKEMIKYRVKMKRWNTKPRKSRQRKGSGEGTDESDVSGSRRPKLPQKPHLGDVRKLIEKRYKEIRRRPGAPNVIIELTNTSNVTPINLLPDGSAKEIQRRKALKKCKVILNLWLNGNEIYSSKPRNISSDFTVFLGFKVPITFHERPELLEVELVEVETKIRTLKMSIPIPDSKTTMERCQMRKLMLFADDVIKVGNGGVGSGTAFEVNGKEYDGIHTKGHITIRCGWAENLEDINKVQNEKEDVLQFVRKQSTTADPNDPRYAYHKDRNFNISPRVEPLSPTEEEVESDYEDNTNGFVLDKLMSEFDFCDISIIEKSARYKLLQLRDQGIAEFRNMKMISPYEKDVVPGIFATYERRLKDDLRKKSGEKNVPTIGRRKHSEGDFVYESNRLEKIREIRLSVLQLFEKSLKQITFEDLVIEEQIPDIGTLGLNLMSFFQPRRPLHPIRKERKRIQASNLVDTKIDLIFNIVRAFNLPLRKDSDVGLITTESLTGIQLQKKRSERGIYSTVRPFVEVWFQRKKVRTTTAMGSNPTWNQEVQLNLTVPNDDFSQSNLSKMDDLIFLLIYDEVSVDLLEDERRRDTDIYQRIERRWLGSISIPFSTLYTNGRIEGTFKLNMPPVLLGYEPQGMSTHFGGMTMSSKGFTSGPSATSFPNNKGTGTGPVSFQNQTNAFVTIFITLQPAVQPSISIKEDNATGESSDMMVFVKNWKNLFERRFSDRFARPFVMTAEGETILCTRYLTPLEFPEHFINEGIETIHTMEMLAHYVSLFPYVRDSTLGITDYSLWFTSDVFVSTPGGGVDDHAVLLTCFFLKLKVPCWIVHGIAIPDGPTTFVVTSFKGIGEDKGIAKSLKNAVLIWNPCTGEYFNVNDNFCPLQKVWSVIGKQNIWANVSEVERPHQLDWNIGKSKTWLPLFSTPMPDDKIPCVQNEIKRYKSSDQTQANSLAQRIERNLKDSFMKWRSTSKTNWNRYCSATLRRLLPKLEDNKSGRSRSHPHHHPHHEPTGSGSTESAMSLTGSVTNLNEEHLIELREVMTSYQMSGFPLQQPYVNMHLIMEAVYATGLHTIDTPDVEFALAAYAHAYPASVYSVWVYVAALHRRK